MDERHCRWPHCRNSLETERFLCPAHKDQVREWGKWVGAFGTLVVAAAVAAVKKLSKQGTGGKA